MTPYVLPSLFALSLKIVLIGISQKQLLKINPVLLALFLSLLGLNICELLSFLGDNIKGIALIIIKFYTLFALSTSFLMLSYSLDLYKKLSLTVSLFLGALFCTCSIILFVPKLTILDVQSIGYSLTRIPGPFYFILQIALALSLLGTIGVNITSIIRPISEQAKRRSLIFLISISPVIFTGLTVILLMAMGAKINGIIFVSLAVIVTLWVLIYLTLMTERKENLYHFMALLPASREQRFILQMSEFLDRPDMGVKEAMATLEQELYYQVLLKTGNNKSKAANIIGVSRQTLLRRYKDMPEVYQKFKDKK